MTEPNQRQYDVIRSPDDTESLLPTSSSSSSSSFLPACCSQPAAKTGILFGIFLLVIIALALAIGLTLGAGVPRPSLASAIGTGAIMHTLNQFQQFAFSSGGSRALFSPAYNLSASYVESQLSASGLWLLSRQYFPAPFYAQLSPPTLALAAPFPLSFLLAADFSGMRYGGNGSYSLPSAAVFAVPAQGCSPDDYLLLAANASVSQEPLVALVSGAGPCSAYDKALLAQAANASAVLLYSAVLSNARVRAVDWTPAAPTVQIPTLSVTSSVAQLLQGLGDAARLALTVNNSFSVYETFNVIATYKGSKAAASGPDQLDPKLAGAADSIVAIGSHLDSVAAGPGINDDGSGSAINLELALKWPSLKKSPRNRYQALWWGSEEEGLIGSRYFVRSLNQSGALGNYALYINMDMLASPNYILKILDGNTTAPAIQGPSSKITGLFERAFEQQHVPYMMSAMTGGSDFLPFIEAGSPSSGLLAGASEIKTSAQREIYGGLANAALDPCYHQPCDTVLNINQDCLNYNSQAAAIVLQKLLLEKNLRTFLNTPN